MNEKVTIVGLRKKIAEQMGISEQKVNDFLSALFPTIVDGLKQDGQVRVGGLGVFRMQKIESRRSVNVQTGESIVIEGYNKVVFTPESGLRDKVNAPYADLEVKLISEDGTLQEVEKSGSPENDPIRRLGEQAEEIKDIIAGFDKEEESENDGDGEQKQEQKEVVEEQDSERSVAASMQTASMQTAERDEQIKENEDMKNKNKNKVNETTEEVVSQATAPIDVNNEDTDTLEDDEQEKKKSRSWLWTGLITVLVFCLILILCYFFLQNKLSAWANNLLGRVEDKKVEQIDVVVEANDEPAEAVYELPERVYDKFIATETLTPGSRLAWLSRKYYGAPDFWVYIYEANKDNIQNPNLITIGTRVKVPELPAELIDVNNEAAMRQAHELHEQYRSIR